MQAELEGERPVSPRALLREMNGELEAAADNWLKHLRKHGCRGAGCKTAKGLAETVADAEHALALTRFLNSEG